MTCKHARAFSLRWAKTFHINTLAYNIQLYLFRSVSLSLTMSTVARQMLTLWLWYHRDKSTRQHRWAATFRWRRVTRQRGLLGRCVEKSLSHANAKKKLHQLCFMLECCLSESPHNKTRSALHASAIFSLI